jgi:hypothetical protein
MEKRKPSYWDIPNCRIFLLGVYSNKSNTLSCLAGQILILETIFHYFLEFDQLFEISFGIDNPYSRGYSLQVPPPFVNFGPVTFPKPMDRKVNMMPFVLGDIQSLPDDLKPYFELTQYCARTCPNEIGNVCYITIDEGFVPAGESQLIPGLHIDGGGLRIVCDGSAGVYFGDFARFHWGGAKACGGIYLASTVSDSCIIYGAKLKKAEIFAQHHGNIEYLRPFLEKKVVQRYSSRTKVTNEIIGKKMNANQLYWITDLTPHESIPLLNGTYRQFFRMVTSEVSGWFEDHSTRNPLGIQPGCPIIKGNKFNSFAPVARYTEEGMLDIQLPK